MKFSKTKFSYYAGFLEGRGRVFFKKDRLVIFVRSDKKKVLKILHREFGGSLYWHKGSKTSPSRCCFEISGEKAVSLLKLLFPYLVCWKAFAKSAFRKAPSTKV